MAEEINSKVLRAKGNKDQEHKDKLKIVGLLPTFIIGPVQTILTYLSQNCGWTIKAFALRGNAWGHGVLTNIGSLGLEEGFAPIPTLIHPTFIICTGKTTRKPVVRLNDKNEEEIVIRPLLRAIFTFDHRYGDAAAALKFIRIIKDYVEDPENFNIDKYEDSKSWKEIEEAKKQK